MRLAFQILVGAMCFCVFWALFLFMMYPVGAADWFYGHYRPQLAKEVGFDRATYLTGQASGPACQFIQQTVLLVAFLLLVSNAAWVLFAFWTMMIPRANRGSKGTPPADLD